MIITYPTPPEPFKTDVAAVGDYCQQSRIFLAHSRLFLAEDDLHQASEKGWAAAAWMAKAVAESQGWQYREHDEFSVVLDNVRRLTGDLRLLGLSGIANDLHSNFYKRKFLLDAETIGGDLDQIAVLLDILEPLTS